MCHPQKLYIYSYLSSKGWCGRWPWSGFSFCWWLVYPAVHRLTNAPHGVQPHPAPDSNQPDAAWTSHQIHHTHSTLIKEDILYHQVWAWLASFWLHKWECPPRSMLDRSAYQHTQWTVATGRLIYPPHFEVYCTLPLVAGFWNFGLNL